jgi:hypothetical protein
MRVRYLTMGFACISYLALGFSPAQVSAQLFRRSPIQQPAVSPQPAPNPAQPVPAATPAQPERQGRIMRGSQFIGLNIRGSDDHQLGIVRDFIVDCQGECPMIYFAVEPDASLQLGQEYVIMPYSAMRYDSRGGSDYFAIDVIGAGLRNAPRVAVNGWSTFNDRQVLGNAHQFYQRTERTTARPIQGGAAQPTEPAARPETPTRPDANTHRDSAPRPEAAPRLDSNPQPGTAPRPESGARPDTAARPENREQPATGTQPDSRPKAPERTEPVR